MFTKIILRYLNTKVKRSIKPTPIQKEKLKEKIASDKSEPNVKKKECTLDLDFDEINEKIEELKNQGKKEVIVPCNKLHNVNVAILNADHSYGQILTFLLKQHPTMKNIFIHGKGCMNIARDCNNIDTTCRVVGYETETQLRSTVRTADIVVILDKTRCHLNDYKSLFLSTAKRIEKIAKICTETCPKAVIITCAKPICGTLSIIQSIFEETPWYHPSRLIGCVTPLQMEFNTLAANYLNLNPYSVFVPILGGSDFESVVPLMSIINPDPVLSLSQTNELLYYIYEHRRKAREKKDPKYELNDGFATAQFVVTVAEGLNGKKDAISTAMVRTNIIPNIKNLVTAVRFGLNGVVENYRIPKLSELEVDQLQRSVKILYTRQNYVQKYIKKKITY